MPLPPEGEVARPTSPRREYPNEQRLRPSPPPDPYKVPGYRTKQDTGRGLRQTHHGKPAARDDDAGLKRSRPRWDPSGRDEQFVVPQTPPLGSRSPSYSSNTSVSNSTEGRSSSKSSAHDENESPWLADAERKLRKRLREREDMRKNRQGLDDGLDRQRPTKELECELDALKLYLKEDLPGLREDELKAAASIEEQQEMLMARQRKHAGGRTRSVAMEHEHAELEAVRRRGCRELDRWEDTERFESKGRMQNLKRELGLRTNRALVSGVQTDVNNTHSATTRVSENERGKMVDASQVPEIVVSAPQHDARHSFRGGDKLRIETVFRDPNPHTRSRSTGDIHSEVSTITTTSSVFECWVKIAGEFSNEPHSVKARAVTDTGCRDNWISLDVLKRARMEDQLQGLLRPLRFEGFGGYVEARSEVELTISATNPSYSRRLWFYALENPPFDMVLGRKFIKNNGFAFASPALILRKPKRSKGK